MTERRRRPHPALGARWASAGLAVAATVGITGYLEIDSLLHPAAAVAAPAPPTTTVPPTAVPPTAVRTDPGPTPARVPVPGGLVVPPPPTVTVRTIPPYVPPATVPPTHARTRGSNG